MAFFFSTPLHQLCKYSSPFSHYNFHSLSTQKHPLQLGFYPLLAKTQVSDIETRNSTTNNKTIEKSLSGYCLSDDDNKRVAENFGKNGVKNGRERDIGHFDTKNSTTNNRTVEKSLFGFCLSDNDNERVVENFGKNGVKNGREREIGSKKNTSNTTYDRTNVKFTSGVCSSVDENKRVVEKNGDNGSKNGSKGGIFMKKLNNEVRGNGVGLVVGENVDSCSKQKIRVSPRSSKNENFVKKLVSVIGKNGSGKGREFGSGKSPRSSKGDVFVKKWNEEVAENGAGLVVERSLEKGSRKRSGIEFGVSTRGPKGENFMKKSKNVDVKKQKGVNKEKNGKTDKNKVTESPGLMERADLDMCSKRGDVMGALNLYDKAQIEGVIVGQYHYSVLLYLCSSAAIGVVSPAKSGKDSRSLSNSEASSLNSIGPNENTEICNDDFANKELNSHISKNRKPKVLDTVGEVDNEVINGTIRLSDDFRKYALKRGFEIYEKMCSEKVAMNEASLTSIARMALAMGDGDMAFDTIKQMKELGINPRLRSYGPALTAFCNSGDIDKAFLVEKHMLEHGVYPEEPEYEALLRVSIEENRSDKVYYLLHKLRSSVRQVSESTADLIETWFNCEEALKVGRMKWDESDIRKAIQRGGGGWHGEGWLGKGKWNVARTNVGVDGFCKCCGGKLATIDLDPVETEKFAESVASIATKREKSSFQKFQKWLDYYGPFEAVVDAANIGLYSQRKFKPSKVNAVVNGIRQMLPSKKWPLIVLHNRRVTDENMDKPMNKAIVEKWKNADALYATPTGSNDDWYWLYAAIKYKCLLVTNDEMRDHLFQLLGNDFFPRWKERHQVRFNFSETGPLFHMPPPCSVVIQESEKGHWHIPMASEYEFTEERKWLCVTRHGTVEKQKSTTMHGANKPK